MDDAAPPQDANPSATKDYTKPADAPSANGGTGPTEGAVAGEVVQSPSPGTGGAPAAAMLTDDPEEGGLPSGGAAVGAGGGGGNLYLRPIFFGNLSHSCLASDVENIFKNPAPGNTDNGEVKAPIPLDRVDMKRGYCFVFLKDPTSMEEKERAENYVTEISGMNISQVSNCLRAEFARGDGRIKRKEDERRKDISPNETLFVVNFHEETTKREDLQMLFEPYGELVRIDMKRNYAFVQFKTIDEAIRAKEATNGGKLDQSEITVEYVARRMGDRDRGGRRDDGHRAGGSRRYDGDRGGDRGGGYRGSGYRGEDRSRRDECRPRSGHRGDRYEDDYRRGGYRDERRRRSRSRSRSPGYRRRSRSRSPPYERDYRSSRDETYRPSSRGGRDSYEDRERIERGYGRSEY